MNTVAKIALATLFVSLVFTLQGCGCDEAGAKKCLKTSCADITGCIDDTGCCDYEKDGLKTKDALKLICDAQVLLTLAKSDDNKCA